MKKIDKALEEQIIQDYSINNLPVKEIAEKYSVGIQTIFCIIKRNNVVNRKEMNSTLNANKRKEILAEELLKKGSKLIEWDGLASHKFTFLCSKCQKNEGQNIWFNFFNQNKNRLCLCKECLKTQKTEDTKQVMLKRYGKENALQVDEFKEKVKETKLERYGDGNYNNREKSKQTCLEKYGTNSPMQNKEISGKVKKWYCNHFNEVFSQIKHLNEWQNKELFLQKVKELKSSFNLQEYFNCSDTTLCRKIRKFNAREFIVNNGTIPEEEIKHFLEENNINYLFSDRNIINPLELDFILKDYNIAIEFDGLFWHSYNKHPDKNRHLNKTVQCENKGFKLFHIFSNEWESPIKREIWKSMILNATAKSKNKIYARKCIVKEVSIADSNLFLEKNHLQGKCNSLIKLGLYFNNELISLMTFGKSRFNKKYEWELLRFCNKLNTVVVGGASKLLAHFTKKYEPKSIISYANRRWSNGNLYKKLGFKLESISKPSYFYFHSNEPTIIHNRMEFQKKKLKDKLTDFDKNKTEAENMKDNGWFSIYDCGNLVFTK